MRIWFSNGKTKREDMYGKRTKQKVSRSGIIRRMLLKTEHTRHSRNFNDHQCIDLGNAAQKPVRTHIRGSPLLQV